MLGGCGDRLPEPIRDCSFRDGLVDTGWVPLFGGHSYDWLFLSHRVAYLRAGVNPPDEDGSFEVPLGLSGGDWSTGQFDSDWPWYEVTHTRVSTDAVQAYFGSTELTVPSSGEVRLDVPIDPADVGLPALGPANPGDPPQSKYAVVLRGLCFDTDVPLGPDYKGSYDRKLGWTVRALGASATRRSPRNNPDVDDDQIVVALEARYHSGPLDRSDLNEAIPHSSVKATVAWAILYADDAEHTPTTEHRSDMFYATRGDSYTPTPLPPEEERRFIIDGAEGPSARTAVPLLHGFNLELNAAQQDDKKGRYLRGWHAFIEDFDYDPPTGRGQFLMDGWASHTSALQEGDLEVEFTADLSMLQLPQSARPIAGTATGYFDPSEPLGAKSHTVGAPQVQSDLR
jgi:hypothetical protein